VLAKRSLYRDEWLDVRLADVELPDGRRIEHRLIRTRPSAGAVVIDTSLRVLLLWRHRFITDTWGWEIPLGKVEGGEDPIAAAARETEEETGWRPTGLRPLVCTEPTYGISDSRHHVFLSERPTRVGAPIDSIESERVEWVGLSGVPDLIAAGEIACATTLASLLLTAALTSRAR
jgi:8-oxo-dGTP pyrophosphatase MutT (NUDIX family)